MSFDVVVPTIGRPSLARLLDALARSSGPRPGRVLLVLDRAVAPPAAQHGLPVTVLHGTGRGPAAARNVGWKASRADWIAFLDDDVEPGPDWLEQLAADLAVPAQVAGVQGRLQVPVSARPTDWERNVQGLERARWATADMAYRRRTLEALGGFDERFPRAYREDADLALRVLAAGKELRVGRRASVHPVGPAGSWVSVRVQAGNADDALMDVLHGPGWRARASVPRGRFRRHALVTAAAGAALLAVRRPAGALALAAWAAGTAELAWARVAPGPRTAGEVARMLVTSAAIPPVAVYHRVRGVLRARRVRKRLRPAAVLFDRDGTLVEDVPYNGDPARVALMPGAREAVDRLRAAGVKTAVVSNQSGVGRGLVTRAQVDAVNTRIEELLGPVGPWLVCPHAPGDGCECRKPAPGLVLRAARKLEVRPADCVVVGDIGADVDAGRAAGARAILVPTSRTKPDEVAAADVVAPDLAAAVDLLLGGAR
jgi:histidinol-phosphate phosphatase family protein